ncbi:MAG: bacterioferritin [Pseudomonadota bacterium]
MQGNKQVIDLLNAALRKELTAVNQYMLHSRMLNDWGVTRLGEKEYGEAKEEMEHADWLIERILFLEGEPAMEGTDQLNIGHTVEEILRSDLNMELEAHPMYRDAVTKAGKLEDYGSRDLFLKILKSEEEHIDFLETQLAMIERMGIENYIMLQSKPVDQMAA